ncbi:MAG: hypothetical protein IJD92_02420 [Bacilli bacterium]|nr:hypothetical protein [Bacilli bacterium]
MDLETHRKIYKIKQDSYKSYVKEKIKDLDVLTENDINNILNIINEDYNKEKNNIIEKTIELFYNHKKYKKFINKDNYKNKIKNHLYIIDNIKNYVKRTYNINNNYSLYYCKYQASELIDIYENKKEIYKILKYLILKLSILEQKYSDILKVLYREIENYEELKNIRTYESFYRKSQFEQQDQIMNITNAMSKNIKTLKYNCDKIIDNGFFGL